MTRRFFFVLLSLFLLTACQKQQDEQEILVLPEVVIAVAPFTQPETTSDLLSGFIPEDRKLVSQKTLSELDMLLRDKLHRDKHKYAFLKLSDITGNPAKDERGRRNALAAWANYAKKSGADMILVPQLIYLQEREGSKAGVMKPAAVIEDFHLIDARNPVSLSARSHFAEEQKDLASDITKIGKFLERGAGWLSARDLAAEGMDKAVKELGL